MFEYLMHIYKNILAIKGALEPTKIEKPYIYLRSTAFPHHMMLSSSFLIGNLMQVMDASNGRKPALV